MAGTTGSYNVVTLTPGKKHRVRIINTSIDTQMRVSLDGHPFQVIQHDFVPIQPYTTNWLILGIGTVYLLPLEMYFAKRIRSTL